MLTVVFVLLGLVVAGMIIGGLLAFLPSKALGDIERKFTRPQSGGDKDSKNSR